MMDWYNTVIEDDIRPIVKLLRDNGFNTINSCGHEMYCQCELYLDVPPLRVYKLLKEAGYEKFDVRTRIEYDGTRQMILLDFVIWFPRKDGSYSPKRDGVYEEEKEEEP